MSAEHMYGRLHNKNTTSWYLYNTEYFDLFADFTGVCVARVDIYWTLIAFIPFAGAVSSFPTPFPKLTQAEPVYCHRDKKNNWNS
jgi:hypothetical protein